MVLFAGRDRSTAERESLDSPLQAAATQLAESCLLRTCHRIELIGVLDGRAPPAPRGTQVATGRDALARVLIVAAGLDSAVVAEEQLLGQFRDAYASALAARRTGAILNELMRRAIRIGKHARSMARPGTPRSLAAAAVAWAAGEGGTRGASMAGQPALVLGTGDVARDLASHLAALRLVVHVVSSDPRRAGRLVEAIGGDPHRAIPAEGVADIEWRVVAAGTRIHEPILRSEHERALRRARVIDLCAPAAVAPDLRERLGERLMDLDRLAADGQAIPSLSPATRRRLTKMIDDEQEAFATWLAERTSGDAIGALHRHADALRERHLDRLRRRGIVDDRQLAAVDHMARAMLAELLHVPTVKLRRGGAEAERLRALLGIGP